MVNSTIGKGSASRWEDCQQIVDIEEDEDGSMEFIAFAVGYLGPCTGKCANKVVASSSISKSAVRKLFGRRELFRKLRCLCPINFVVLCELECDGEKCLGRHLVYFR